MFTVGVPYASDSIFRDNVFAAGIAYVAGLRSIDYAKQTYGTHWKLGRSRDAETRLVFELTEIAKEAVSSAEELRPDPAAPQDPHQGMFAADAAIVRLRSAFRVATFATRQACHFEAAVLSRLILEQLAWIATVYRRNWEWQDFLKIHPQRCLTELKKLFPDAGRLYGQLSKTSHIIPAETPRYLRPEGIHVTMPDYRVHDAWHLALLADMHLLLTSRVYHVGDSVPLHWTRRKNGRLDLDQGRCVQKQLKKLWRGVQRYPGGHGGKRP